MVAFWFSAAALLHTYILYPLLIQLLTGKRKINGTVFPPSEVPPVTVLMAAYNEEEVIAQKIESIFNSDYSKEKIELLIGSDNSTDRTNEIVKTLQSKFPQLNLIEFSTRTGKVMIINELVKKSSHGILILTDANVMFDKSTLYELVKHFRNETIALVDSNMINTNLQQHGISNQEKTYIQTEVSIKNAESKLWGCMMGPFGGCYALRKSYFKEVPPNFLVDDFYQNMKVLEQEGKCINETRALVFEDVSNNIKDEFRRKIRIAAGNFQNLFSFTGLLFKFNSISFCFLSHKVLRWLGPLFLITSFVSNILLLHIAFFRFTFIIQVAFYCIPILDILLKKINIHLGLFRFTTHLLAMNLALLLGLIKFLTGIRSSIWQPTRRNQ